MDIVVQVWLYFAFLLGVFVRLADRALHITHSPGAAPSLGGYVKTNRLRILYRFIPAVFIFGPTVPVLSTAEWWTGGLLALTAGSGYEALADSAMKRGMDYQKSRKGNGKQDAT